MAENKKVSVFVRAVRKNPFRLLSFLGALAASALIVYFSFLIYVNYREELVRSEEEELLTMAETVGKSLVIYVEQEIENLDLYFSALETERAEEDADGAVLEQAAEGLLKEKDGLYDAVACYDEENHLLFQKGTVDFAPEDVPDRDGAFICGKKLCPEGWYEMFLSRICRRGAKTYTIIYAMNLNKLYSYTVQPVQIGEGGYSVVKDKDMAIIMHHAASQIGMDAIYDREERYPDLDLTELIDWIEFQRTHDEGYDVIDSYLWDDPRPTPGYQRRIVAYTTIHLPGEDWIVNSTLPYEELDGPLNRMILRLIVMSSLSLLPLAVFVYVMARIRMRTESQKKEIAYLKELNEGMELLRHKEEEIQHYQRVQSIGQMSSHIAHEFNNYLTPVMVYGEILEGDTAISEENRELIRGILTSAGQAADLSRKLLDFSRQDSAAALKTICLTKEMQAALDIIGRLVPENIDFTAEVTETPLYIRGREQMAEHLLMNLCNNAFHAMEDGGSLTVCLREVTAHDLAEAKQGVPFPAGDLPSQLEAGKWVLLSVADTGCGICPDAMDKIFEPFYTTKRSGKGTGLGLSVVRNMVTAAGGRIRVDSREGEGTLFCLYFPLSEPGEPEGAAPLLHPRDRIVVVDDDPNFLKAMGVFFKSLRCRAECYDHPAAVLSRLQNKKDYCDVLITDYAMPSVNGLELAKIVRKLNPAIRLVLISGMNDSRFDWYLKNEFIDAFILKSEVQEKLRGMLAFQ